MPKQAYHTNLASEFYVLSILHRLGIDAHLTLGNKKSVDIVIENGNEVVTIDVKGIAGRTTWPLDNFTRKSKNHFIVLVSFLNQIENPEIVPEVFIVPSTKIEELMYKNPKGTRKGITFSSMRKYGNRYRNNWKSLLKRVKNK